MSAEEELRLLSELDLSEYESRAYLSVVEGGTMVAREISDRASIPYAKVYQTLNDLIEKQLITGDEGRPKKFRARPPEEAIPQRLDRLERSWMEQHQQRKRRVEPLVPQLQSLYDASEVEEEKEQGVWNISGSTNIATRLARLSKMAAEQILVITGSYSSFADHFLRTLVDNAEVPIELVSPEEVENEAFARSYTSEHVGEATTIYFDQVAMMSIAETQKAKYSAGEYTAVVTQISELVRSALVSVEVLRR